MRRAVGSPAVLVSCLLLGSPVAAHAGALATWGVRVSTPQIASASLGVVIGRMDPDDPSADRTHIPSGLLLQVEPGVAGGRVSVGLAKGLLPYAGAGVKASVLRTWGDPFFAKAGQTYAGVEVDATLFIKLSLGVLKRVGGAPGSPDFLVTAGIGMGF